MGDLPHFAQGLAHLKITETECGVALLWFYDHFDPGSERSASELADDIHRLALKSAINVSRFRKGLTSSSHTVSGSAQGTFKLKLSARAKLGEQYLPLLKRPKVEVEDHVLEAADFVGKRQYLEVMVAQINGCYQYGFFDGCLVICRRLAESLLIECFETAGHASAIKSNGEYMMFGPIIEIAKSGKFVKLPRDAGSDLDDIKRIGDKAAHSRTYIAKRRDVDDIKTHYRRLISELMVLSKLTKP